MSSHPLKYGMTNKALKVGHWCWCLALMAGQTQ